MADTSLPPISPLGGTPPPAPLPPLEDDDLLLPEEEDRAASLSPFKMLKRPVVSEPTAVAVSTSLPVVPLPVPPPLPPVAAPTPIPTAVAPEVPPIAPTPVPASVTGGPMSDDVDKDALVSQAAHAPNQPLILPNRRAASTSQLPPVPSGVSKAEFKAPTVLNENTLKQIQVEKRADFEALPPEVLAEGSAVGVKVIKPNESIRVGEPASMARNVGAAPLPPPPLPSAGLRPPTASLPVKNVALNRAVPPILPMSRGKLPPLPLTSPPRQGMRLFAIIGSVVALVLLIGGGFVLALTGARLPLLGGMVSGLPSTASQSSDKAFAFVDTHAPYQFKGLNEVTVTDEKDKTLADGTPSVYKIHTETKDGIVTDKGTRFLAKQEVTINDKTAIPVLMRNTGLQYIVSFPANTDTTPATLASTNLEDTLLDASLKVIPLEALLKAVVTEKSYQKVTVQGKPAAAYSVTLDQTQIAAYLPTGAKIGTATATISFAWKGAGVMPGEPLDVVLNIPFTYQERGYLLSGHWQYSNWAETTVPADLDTLASTDPGNVNTDLTSESFVSRLGIAFKALPHGSVATSGAAVDQTVVFTPIVPDGDVITVVQTPRADNPVQPVQPASAEAKQRDAQRKQDLLGIQKAIEQYIVVNGSYPTVSVETQLAASTTLFNALVPKYLTKMPIDPLNATYYYAYNVTSTGYYLRAILEDNSDTSAMVGSVYHYYELKK
jgi:hypothetical protein